MTGFKLPNQILFCAVVLLVLPLVARSGDLYRYTNHRGVMVIDDRISTEYAARGYEIINEEGAVIEVVPRKLTEEELARRDIDRQLTDAAELERLRLQKWDESLLLRYSTIEDIEAARDRALRDLRIRVSILKSNTRTLKLQVENYQATAADIERGGGTVDVQRLAAIEELQSEIAVTERSIADRVAEIEQVEKAFQLDIDRFALLLELVELRRSMFAKDQ